MTPSSFKRPLNILAAVIAAGLLIFGLLHIKAILLLGGKMLAALMNNFDRIIRKKIGYWSTAAVFAGLAGAVLYRGWSLYGLSDRFGSITGSFKRMLKKYPAWGPVFYVMPTLSVIGLFLTVPFSYAFSAAAGWVIFLLLKFKDDRGKIHILSVMVILLFFAPHLFLGDGIHVKIFDTLDGNIPQIKVLAESGKAFSLDLDAKLDNFINGMSLSGVFSGYNVVTWTYMIFSPITAYIINVLMMAFAGFFGMVLLLRKYVVKPADEWIIAGSALCFSLLPFYFPSALSFAAFPLLLYAFFNIRGGEGRWRDYIIIFVYPFYSRLALAGVFIIMVLGLVFLWDLIRKRRWNMPFFGASALLTGTYVLTNIQRIYSFVNPEFVSHRAEILPSATSIADSLRLSLDNFIFDTTNNIGAQGVFILIAAAAAVWVAMRKKDGNRNLLTVLLLLAMVNALLWGFKYSEGMALLRAKFQILNAFNFSRFYFFNPFVWHLIFAVSLLILVKTRYGKRIVSALLILQLLFLFTGYNPDFRHMMGLKNKLKYTLSYKEFYSEALFAEIDATIKKPRSDYRIACIGFHPGIAQYNGFYTLDVYANIYPLKYKHQFRRIIERELEKSPNLGRGFDHNAKRCYILVSELHGKKKIRGMAFTRGLTKKDSKLKIRNLELNTEVFREMGGEYIFSAVEILNHAENDLEFEKTFKRKDSPWKIYLYRAAPTSDERPPVL